MNNYIVSKEFLNKLIDQSASCLVGKILKRYEIIEDKNSLKKEIKEMIYEHFRDLKSFVEAFGSGVNFTSDKNSDKKE